MQNAQTLQDEKMTATVFVSISKDVCEQTDRMMDSLEYNGHMRGAYREGNSYDIQG